MMIVEINKQEVKIPTAWSDISYNQAAKCYELNYPTDIDDSFDWFRHLNVVKQVFKILTGFEDVDNIEQCSIVHYFSKYMVKFVYDLKAPQPSSYVPKLINSFTHNGVKYLLPESLDLGVNIVLQHSQTTKSFIEASNLLAQFSALKKDGFKALPLFVASLVKVDVNEEWDESVIVDRSAQFETLPMNVIWEVFFCTSQLIIKYGSDTLQSMIEVQNRENKKLVNRLASRYGHLKSREAELREQLKMLTR